MKNSLYGLFALLMIGTLTSCRKDFKNVPEYSLRIATIFPSNYLKQEANDVDLIITNNITRAEYTGVSDENGIYTFSGVMAGSYKISARRYVSPSEAYELTGIPDVYYYLNGDTSLVVGADGTLPVQLSGTPNRGLVFKELYYTGSRTPAGGTYFSDQFYEIYNNSSEILYADSLCIGNTGGANGSSATATPYGFRSDNDNVYLQNVWMVPGSGTDYPILPGQSIIIAQDGIDHITDVNGNPASPVNLGPGIADFESYVPRADNRDLDAAEVPNLIPIYLGSVGFDWLTAVFGPGMVIFKHPDPMNLALVREPGVTSTAEYMQVPVDYVYDAVDALANERSFGFKRLPTSLDAGFINCSGTYVGESIRRKIERTENGRIIVWDTNNTSFDFEVLTKPTPKSW